MLYCLDLRQEHCRHHDHHGAEHVGDDGCHVRLRYISLSLSIYIYVCIHNTCNNTYNNNNDDTTTTTNNNNDNIYYYYDHDYNMLNMTH